jgi:hypothetical protein
MTSRASLIEVFPELHYNQEFYYRSVATVKGKNAEVSEAYSIEVIIDTYFHYSSS